MPQFKASKVMSAVAALVGAYLLYLALGNALQFWQRSGASVAQQATLTACSIHRQEGSGYIAGFASSTQYVGHLNYRLPNGDTVQASWQGVNPPPAGLCAPSSPATLLISVRAPSIASLPEHPETRGPGLLLTLMIQVILGLLILRLAGLSLAKPAA